MLDEIIQLECKGFWELALKRMKIHLLTTGKFNSNNLHLLGRLYQRLKRLNPARKAYKKVLEIESNTPKTINNLILLELDAFNIEKANYWLDKSLSLSHLELNDKELIYNTACDLKLFELKHGEALHYINTILREKLSVISLCNKSVCLQKLNKLAEAISIQLEAIILHLNINKSDLISKPIEELVGQRCGEIEESIRLQITLMNLGILKLSKDPFDSIGLQLIKAGMYYDRENWINPTRDLSIWQGELTEKLLIWDDQGYGDSIQNLAWISSAATKVKELELWLRPSLIKLVKTKYSLPENCVIKVLEDKTIPPSTKSKHLGLFFLPFILGEWNRSNLKSASGCMKSNHYSSTKKQSKIGIIWSAGKHKAPQPERNARIRDIPFDEMWHTACEWKNRYNLELYSLQLEGDKEERLREKIDSKLLHSPLKSSDWLDTAKVLESLDLIVSVDTSIAHLAGSMGIPCILMLSCPADWRWGQSGTKSFIYESIFICRCHIPGDWSQAIKEANNAIYRFFRENIE